MEVFRQPGRRIGRTRDVHIESMAAAKFLIVPNRSIQLSDSDVSSRDFVDFRALAVWYWMNAFAVYLVLEETAVGHGTARHLRMTRNLKEAPRCYIVIAFRLAFVVFRILFPSTTL